MDPVYVIKRPLLTEKTTMSQGEANVYAFEVARGARKPEIKAAVEKAYGVTVEKVNTQVRKGKSRRTRFGYSKEAETKKATVRLKEGDTIELI